MSSFTFVSETIEQIEKVYSEILNLKYDEYSNKSIIQEQDIEYLTASLTEYVLSYIKHVKTVILPELEDYVRTIDEKIRLFDMKEIFDYERASRFTNKSDIPIQIYNKYRQSLNMLEYLRKTKNMALLQYSRSVSYHNDKIKLFQEMLNGQLLIDLVKEVSDFEE